MFGEFTIKNTMLLAGVALALSVLAAPLLDGAAEKYAQTRSFGIDQVITSSINKSNRVTIRKSVLSDDVERICQDPSVTDC